MSMGALVTSAVRNGDMVKLDTDGACESDF